MTGVSAGRHHVAQVSKLPGRRINDGYISPIGQRAMTLGFQRAWPVCRTEAGKRTRSSLAGELLNVIYEFGVLRNDQQVQRPPPRFGPHHFEVAVEEGTGPISLNL